MEPLRATRATLARSSAAWSRGVTLVELLVVLGIILILSLVVITSHANFNKTILLTSTAYDVALTVRSAQTYGLGTRTVGEQADIENIGYGVHFRPDVNTFILFRDANAAPTACHPLVGTGSPDAPDAILGNCAYDPALSEMVTTYTLGNGMKIDNGGICVYPDPVTGGSNWKCDLSSMDIVFARPNTRAFFSYNGSYGAQGTASITKARIKIVSAQGGESYVCVARTGEVRTVHMNTAC